jgi:hypothetical protein
MDGKIKGVLDESTLLFERRDGKGLRIEINSIQRVRHHHIPMMPPSITWLGVITILLAARVLSGSIQLYALAFGTITIFTWLVGRRPTLCIDTKAGDRHILHGGDSLLLRAQMMINRLCDGKTIEEAREGLEELHRHSNYPTVRPLESVQLEAALINNEIVEEAELLPEPDVFDEADLERALANMYNGREDNIPEPQPPTLLEPAMATEAFGSDNSADRAGRSLLDRARTSLQETRESTPEWGNIATSSPSPNENIKPWEQPWEQREKPVEKEIDSAYLRAWGRNEPEWYQERGNETRIQSALSDAKDAGVSFAGSMFDDSASQGESGIFGNLFDTPPMTNEISTPILPEPTPLPESSPVWSGEAIRQATDSMSLTRTLPEPTLHALREECTPGLVASARARDYPRSIQSEISEECLQKNEALAAFPALSAMLKSSPQSRLRNNSAPKEGRLARIARRSLNMLKSIDSSKMGKKERPVQINNDDYATIYGDSDGFADGEFRDYSLRSGQILRLRADQDHQAELAERIISLSQSSGGDLAEDAAGDLIERLSASGDLGPIANLLKAADENLSFSNMTSTSPQKESPGHHGISRLG